MKFIRSNKTLTVILIFTVFIIISYILTMDSSEWFDGAERWFNLAFQLSVGFAINFMFYVTQVYIPNSKRDKSARECVYARINKIIAWINKSLLILGQKYIPGHNGDTYTVDDLKKLMNLKFSDLVNVKKIETSSYFSVREWIRECLYRTEKEIDKLYQYYPNYISAKLMNALEGVINCTYHRIMHTLLEDPDDVSFSNDDNCFFTQYYELRNELKIIRDNEYV